MWYWVVIGISIIVFSFITETYIEKKIEKRYKIAVTSGIASEIVGIILVLLWASLLLGVFIGKKVME